MSEDSFLKRTSTWIIFILIFLVLVFSKIASQEQERHQITPEEQAENASICAHWGGTIDVEGRCVNEAGQDIAGNGK